MIRPSAKLAVFVKLFIVFWLFEQCNSGPAKPRVLVFEKAEFYLHESTSAGEKLIAQLCSDRGIGMDVTEEAEDFADRNLRKYNAVIFLNTAGDVLNAEQQASFERYIHAGGNFLGIHTAIDTEHK